MKKEVHMLKRSASLFIAVFIFSLLVPSSIMAQNQAIVGTWEINANNYKGKLEIRAAGTGLAGRVWYDADRIWEGLTNISFDSRSGTLRFTRPLPAQRYTGHLSGNLITGTFDQGGAGNYQWQASKTSAQASPPAVSPSKPNQPGSPQQSAAASVKTIFDNWNKAGVMNGPTRSTQFSINTPVTITRILNYHWNNGKGYTIGTIALKAGNGRIYGPWQASGLPSAVPAANWIVKPNVTIPAGTYTVIDSHPATWSHNSGTNGAGFSSIQGH